MASSLTIDHICTELDIFIIPNFRGVFGRDEFLAEWRDNLLGQLNLFIINTDVLQNKGTHWTLYAISKDKSWWYDSFCQQPAAYGLDIWS